MSIKQNGGVFGRNPTFNDVTIEGQLTFEGNIDIDSDITWEDGKKALFGDSGDLQIYHDSSDSYIKDVGTGDLKIMGANVEIATVGGNKYFDGAVNVATLYHTNNPKLATTSSGVDVTGTVTADGMTISGTAFAGMNIQAGASSLAAIDFGDSADSNIGGINYNNADDTLNLRSGNANRLTVASNGDVSIPNGNLAVGVSTAGTPLHVTSGTDNNIANDVSEGRIIGADKALTGEQANLVIQTNDDMAINKGGSIGFGGRATTSSTNGNNFAQIGGRKENGTSGNYSGYLSFGTSDSASDIHERMTISSTGNVSIPNGELYINGSSLPTGSTAGFGFTSDQFYTSTTATSANTQVRFYNGNGLVGSIVTDGSATAFNTSSDYRLKEDVQPMSGATDRLKELKPVNFAWKADGSRVDGFLAHEAQEVVPESVTGSKDAMKTEEYEVSPATGDIYTPEVVAVEGVEAVEYVAPQDEVLDEEGNVVTEAVAEVMAVEAVEAVEGVAEVIVSSDVEQPSELEDGQLWRETTAQVMGEREVPDYQGIDQAKLVPLLVATIQELEARITALES